MIRLVTRLLSAAAVLALTACASAPVHYYTLVAPPSQPAATSTASSTPFELLPVGVPAQVDQPQLVVRQGGQSVVMLGGERWIAPLSAELRDALSTDLARELHSQDVSGMTTGEQPRLRIKLDVRRFDSQLDRQALIEAAWSVRLLHGSAPAQLACTSRVGESVGSGYAALVQGHQRALAQIAAQIAEVARALGRGQTARCPAG